MAQGSSSPREKFVEYASSNTSHDTNQKTKKTLEAREAGSGNGARSHRATADQGTAHVSTEHPASARNDHPSMSLTASPRSSHKEAEERPASEHSSGEESIAPLPPTRAFPRSMASRHLPRLGAATSERSDASDGSRAQKSTASGSHKRSASQVQNPSPKPTTTTTTTTTTTNTTTTTTTPASQTNHLPRIGAGTSERSDASSGSRMERSTASESQEAPRRKRSTSQPANPAPTSSSTTTTTAHKAVTAPTSTNTTTITITSGIKTRAETPAELKSPLARQLVSDERKQGKADLKDPREILRRAQIRDTLFADLLAGDFSKVTSTLYTLPPIQHFSKYFPPACPTKWDERVTEAARRYTKAHGFAGLNSFIRSTGWVMRERKILLERVQQDLDMRKLNPKAVQDVCMALASTPEEEVQNQVQMLVDSIKSAMKTEKLKNFLASQPFASLKLLNLKCTVLKRYTDSETVKKFHKILMQAKKLQSSHGRLLAKALLKVPPRESEWKPLLCMNFAMMKTTSPADYVAKELTWEGTKLTFDAVDRLHSSTAPASANADGDSWDVTMLAFLKWRLGSTLKKLEDPDEAS